MKLNSNVALTLILLTLMFGAGVTSAAWGFALGREALKGVTQPDVRPTSKLANRPQTGTQRPAKLLKEAEILAGVKARIEGSAKEGKPAAKPADNKAKANSTPAKPDATPPSGSSESSFPAISQDRGVVLEVASARQQGGSLLLDVKLRNDGTQAVRFLYSFLNVTDDRGRTLSATAAGLPGELPPRSQTFSGTVSVPTTLLEDAQKLSLTLTDYPDQKLQLQLSGIPVVR